MYTCSNSLHLTTSRVFSSKSNENANAGILTNFEVYDFLIKKGASTDPGQRLMSTKCRQSELEVFDYLVKSPASNQTRESIDEFMEKAKEFNLAKADVLNIVDIRPIDIVEATPCIEDWEKRLLDNTQLEELQNMIDTLLPPHPHHTKDEVEDSEQPINEETPEDQMDA